MKSLIKRPGFEAIFYMGITLLVILPAMVFAQQSNTLFTAPSTKQMALIDVMVKHVPKYDINGNVLNNPMLKWPGSDSLRNFKYYLYNNPAGNNNGPLVEPHNHVTYSKIDHMAILHPDMSQYRMPIFGGREDAGEQLSVDLNAISKDGVGTSSLFRVSAAMPDMEKKLIGEAISGLVIFNLAITPEFSTAKTQVAFTLPAATDADISFTNNDGQPIWSEKSTGVKFNKTFMLPFSGVYYLVVKQGGKAAVRQVVKR
ncbi:MAG: T9SS type A sorting domain-containing protein [Bacteroidota bacterium]